MWCRNLVKGGEKTVQFVSENVNYQSPALPGEEIHLVELGTEITGEWAVLREQLLTTYAAGFSDKDIRDLKQEAIRSQPEAVGAASFVRFRNVNRGVYKPYYDRFHYMVDMQVEIWDDLLQLCDTPSPHHLESVIRHLDELPPNQLQVNESGSHGQGYNCRQYAENQQHTPLLFLVILTPLPYQASFTCSWFGGRGHNWLTRDSTVKANLTMTEQCSLLRHGRYFSKLSSTL